VLKQEWLNGSNGPVPKAKLNPETQKQFNSGATIALSVETKTSSNGHANGSSSLEKKSEPTIVYEQQASDVIVSAPYTSVRNKINEANNKLGSDHATEQPTVITPQTPVAATPVSYNILREKKPQNTLNTPTTQNRATKTKSGKFYTQPFKLFKNASLSS
jgi:hypothetical protein